MCLFGIQERGPLKLQLATLISPTSSGSEKIRESDSDRIKDFDIMLLSRDFFVVEPRARVNWTTRS